MDLHIVPECYFDTVLVKAILKTKKVNHQKGCNNVEKTVKKLNDFAVGVVDKDKKDLIYLREECIEEIKTNNLTLWKHKTKQHYFIQLVPAIESWIIKVAAESELNLEEIGLPKDAKNLRRVTKSQFVNENETLKILCKRIVEANSATVSILVKWLIYLHTHNRDADINALKQ